jgi:DNA-binding transcriptional LysR family regulator
VAAATGEIRGRLAVGTIPTVAAVDVPAALRVFHERHPHVRVALTMGASESLIRRIRDGRLDLAFLGLASDVAVPGVQDHILSTDRHVAVLAPDHPLAAARRVRLSRLAKETFIDFPTGSSARAQTDQAFDEAGLTREVPFEVTDVHLMAALVREGLGVVLLPSTFAPTLQGLVTVPVVGAPQRVEHLIWSRIGLPPATAAFLAQIDIPPLTAHP